jgi:hypothetical protein
MRPHLAAVCAACAVIALAACDAPTDPLQVTVRTESLRLKNATESAAYYFLVESETSALLDWAPCADPSTCANVPPRGETIVPYDEIFGYESGDREAILYWWHLEPAPGGGFQPVSVRVERVQLGPGD